MKNNFWSYSFILLIWNFMLLTLLFFHTSCASSSLYLHSCIFSFFLKYLVYEFYLWVKYWQKHIDDLMC